MANNKNGKNSVTPLFSEFDYSVVKSSLEGYKQVQVIYNYKGEKVSNYVFVEIVAKEKNDYYIEKAKLQITQKIKDGTLEKETKKFLSSGTGGKPTSKAGKIALVCTSVAALALGGLLIYKFLTGPTSDGKLTITVDPNGGKLNDEEHTTGVKKFKVEKDSTWKALNTKIAINPAGASWEGWDYCIEGEDKWTHIGKDDDITFTTDTSVRANFNLIGDMVKVTVDNNGATWDPNLGYGADEIVTKLYESGRTWGEIKDDFKIVDVPSGYDKNTLKYQYFNPAKHGEDKWDDLGDGQPLADIGGEISIRAHYRDIMYTVILNDPFVGLKDDTPEIEIPLIRANETWLEYSHRIPSKQEIQAHCKNNYTFAGYYLMTGLHDYVEIEDNHKFIGDTNIYLMYYVPVNFAHDGDDRGTLPYKSASLLTSTKWEDIEDTYTPTPTGDWINGKVNEEGSSDPLPEGYRISKPTQINFHYEAKPATSFADDSWNIFLNEVGKYDTLAELKAGRYAGDLQDNSFVGLERELEVANRTYKVRVIDEHDRAPSTPGLADSLLTFEFEQTVYLDTKYNDDSNYFDDSELSKYLDGDFLLGFPSEVISAIKGKQVKYYKHNDPDYTTGDVITTTEPVKLFPLSAYEMGFTKYPADEGGTAEDIKPEGEKVMDYYNGAEASKRQKMRIGVGTDHVAYWLRSADIANVDSTWFINPNGTMGQLDDDLQIYCSADYESSLAVAPAFEI